MDENGNLVESSASITIEQVDGATIPFSSSDSSYTLSNVSGGTEFRFRSSGSHDVYMWKAYATTTNNQEQELDKSFIEFVNGSSSSERYFTFTLPDDVSNVTTYTIKFYVDEDAIKTVNNLDNNTNDDGNLEYGQYGFGDDKAEVCGEDARDYVKYSFVTPSLADYNQGYADDKYNDISDLGSVTTGNQYGILTNTSEAEDNYIEFTLPSDGNNTDVLVTIDATNAYYVTDVTNGTNGTTEDATGKTSFKLTAGHTYRITAGAQKAYIKSIRVFNTSNIFNTDVTDFDTTNNQSNSTTTSEENRVKLVGTGSDLADTALGEALRLTGSEGKIYRVIGKIVEGDISVDQIYAVGFDVYNKTDYDTACANLSAGDGDNQYYNEGVSSMLSGYDAPTCYTITFDDTVNKAYTNDVNDITTEYISSETESKITEAGDGYYFVQTFIEASTSKVLVPWVQYSENGTKVYSSHEEPALVVIMADSSN